MAARFAWVLNLDADLELAVPAYTPRASIVRAMEEYVPRIAASLLGPDDVLVAEGAARDARGLVGRAFCPTMRALALLRAAGAEPEPHPSMDVLRRVNSRAFSAALGPTIEGGAFVTDVASAEEVLRADPPIGDGWRLKRAFGMTGRGHRVVRALDDADRAFIRASMAIGGLQIEPNVAIEEEYAIHGMITPDGELARIGHLVVQHCDARGAWLSSERAERPAVATRLEEEARRVARALADAGYFGPFGIDAFAHADGFSQRSEINARYTMGFGIGFGRGS